MHNYVHKIKKNEILMILFSLIKNLDLKKPMSTTIYGITGTYQKQSLDLIKSQGEVNWDDYPVLITEIN